MKLLFQSPQFCFPSYITIIIFLLFAHSTSKATTLEACNDYICEDVTLVKAVPYVLDLQTLTGEWCSFLSFTIDSLNHSLLIPEEGVFEYTVYHLLTKDSCTANIEIICSVVCPEDTTVIIPFSENSMTLQASAFSTESCYNDEVFLQPHENGIFTKGLYDVSIYSPIVDAICVTELNVITECNAVECNAITNENYNNIAWPQRILNYPCPDTMAYLMEIFDKNGELLLSGNPLVLDESLPDTTDIRITDMETGNYCTSELRLYENCLQYAKDTISLDFTGLDSIIVPWDSLFTNPCGHQWEAGYGSGHTPQDDKIEFIVGQGGYIFKNSFLDTKIFFYDIRADSNHSAGIVFENLSLSQLNGHVFQDLEGDCELDSILDSGPANMLVYAENQTDIFFTYTMSDGSFNFQIPEFYEYEIGLIKENNFWDECISETPIYLGDEPGTVDIGLTTDTICSYLTSYLSIPRFRRCFDNNIYIEYCNLGSDTAYDVTLDFYYDDGLDIDPDLYGFTVVDDGHFQLDIGTLAPLECEELTVVAFVDCDLEFDTELCVEIELGPIPDCNDPAEWSGAALDVQGICDGDSVRFVITNIGEADMMAPRSFIVIEDDIMIIDDMTDLPEGESIDIVFPANGSTYRLIADQEQFHPYTEQVSALVKACSEDGMGISTGFANSFVLDEQAPYISIECMPVVGSYDPNDKMVTPTGAYENHVIEGDEKLEYTIRFENTGTDTAFTVLIRDTLDSNLDLLTFNLIGSSHPVEVDYPTSGLLFFKFLNIELPDTSVNKLGAQGFVKYTIRPKPNLPLESKIYNTADIFFDFNSPITTNTVDLQVGEIISTGLNELPALKSDFISPNPTLATLNVDADFDRYTITNINGTSLKSGGSVLQLEVNDLSSGLYIIQIYKNDVLIGIDRFVKIDKQ